MASDIGAVLRRILAGLDALGIDSLLGGSVASSMRGVMRMTNDIDIVADIRADQVQGLLAEFGGDFYVDEGAVREAIAHWSCFSMLHLDTMVKVDLFVKEPSPWSDAEWQRRTREPVDSGPDAPTAFVASAEDLILQKLHWYRLGRCVSERQWGDVIGMLKVQAGSLDLVYLRQWATQREVADLLERALEEAER